ncbi:MAG TPA: hypothetical protein VF764_08175 [Steroidobacteraceae bacterium]
MSVIKEFSCKVHGPFESTHPICLEVGCEAEVVREFRTPPSIGSEYLKRFDKGIKQSVDMMKLGNLRTARAGEAAYGNGGKGMYWSDEVKTALGVDMAGLVNAASRPFKITYRDGREETLPKSVMRELGADGMTKRVLPKPAEITGHQSDRGPRK